MSIDIDWEGLTTGSEGLALAESIKDFIHEKFQQVQLPRFIRSVEVHSFDFGKECPVVELKDICDPLSEFYDAEEEDDEDDHGEIDDSPDDGQANVTSRNTLDQQTQPSGQLVGAPRSDVTHRPLPLDTRFAGLRADLSRSSTPGIPGGTSNLSYFHLPLSAGLSGTTTPLAAFAGAGALSAAWTDTQLGNHFARLRQHSPVRQQQQNQPRSPLSYADPSARPSTSDSYAQPHDKIAASMDDAETQPNKTDEPDPSDVQIVLRISYSGSVRLSITAEILLDYPMPSFVGIPLKLNITGLSFDGVALIAYLRKKAHFCFLAPEDAHTLVGSEDRAHHPAQEAEKGLGGLLREIRVESEIGRQEGGKQVLKNVGKVEKFVLEQVRRIFEEEFVWPSFWTFLV